MSIIEENRSFGLVREIGDHKVLSYDTKVHTFFEYFDTLFSQEKLEQLHVACPEYIDFQSGKMSDISDNETTLHKMFYQDIKTKNTFKILYCNLIKNIYEELFPDQKCMIYQAFPSVRFQFPGNVAVPPHFDSDKIGKHPHGEKNFLLPITSMRGSKRLYIETRPRKNDFLGIDLEYGDLFFFNGNTCTHYNEKNIEKSLRISLDFRIMLLDEYKAYIMSDCVTTTNPRDPEKKRTPTKMIIGGYYQIAFKDDTLSNMLHWHFQKDMLLQSRPVFDESEAIACYNYMKEDNFVTEYKYTNMLEKEISDFINVKHCILTTSGTAAIILALMAGNVTHGDEVIVPNYTMIATVNSVRMVGATPIIIDVDKNTFTISLDEIMSHVTQKTKAILHVSLNNRHSDIQSIQKYCTENKLVFIEDAAQSLGCFVAENKKHFGTFGDMGCFSLSTPKIISTGQGGFVVTNHDQLAHAIRMLKNFGREESGNDTFESFGVNFKFTDIQAVIGLEQMKKVPERIRRLREIFDSYYENLFKCCHMIKPQSDFWIPWFVDIHVQNRDDLFFFLKTHNIQTRKTYSVINQSPMYFSDTIHKNSMYVSSNGLFLPTHMKVSNEEIKHICDLIKAFHLTDHQKIF